MNESWEGDKRYIGKSSDHTYNVSTCQTCRVEVVGGNPVAPLKSSSLQAVLLAPSSALKRPEFVRSSLASFSRPTSKRRPSPRCFDCLSRSSRVQKRRVRNVRTFGTQGGWFAQRKRCSFFTGTLWCFARSGGGTKP